MSNSNDFKAPPASWAKVDAVADQLRSSLHMQKVYRLPVVAIVEEILYEQLDLFEFQVRDQSEMGTAEGLTCPNGTFVRFREDVYRSACSDGERARFTFAHELGHFFLHTNVPLARALPSETIAPYRSAETQANRFAATLLVPAGLVTPSHSVQQVMKDFAVSKQVAEIRLKGLKTKGII